MLTRLLCRRARRKLVTFIVFTSIWQLCQALNNFTEVSTVIQPPNIGFTNLRAGDPNIVVINGTFGIATALNVSRQNSYIVQYSYDYLNETVDKKAIRMYVSSPNATNSYPILFVVKQQLGILSWQIPLFADNRFGFYTVSRTLCPVQDYFPASKIAPEQTIFIDVSSSSPSPVSVELRLNNEENFYLDIDRPVNIVSSPSQPWFFRVDFPNDTDHLLVSVTSPDTLCAVASVQDARCPVFDLDRNVQFNGTFQTMTTKAAIAATRKSFRDGFFLVLVVKSTDEMCSGKHGTNSNDRFRLKNFTVEIMTTVSEKQYWIATFGIIGVFLLFYLFAVVVAFFYCIRGFDRQHLLLARAEECNYDYEGRIEDSTSYGTITRIFFKNNPYSFLCSILFFRFQINVFLPHIASSSFACPAPNNDHNLPYERRPLLTQPISSSFIEEDTTSSLDETEIDLLPDADSEKEIVRTKTFLYVSDLSRKKCKTLRKKSQMYSWNVMTIAILYALPVVQLVLTYQQALNATGNQDICFYNFLCAHPRGYFSDFNHVYSNIGYILLGFLFLSLVWRRDLMHQRLLAINSNFEKQYGLPHHFGLFYAMAVALMMEGLLSACYHVCPNYTNFQFDASFMYMIAGLCMLKLYQIRHPDINANAYGASLAFAIVILIAVVGVLYGNMLYWVLFVIVHILSCLALTAQIYYMGRWKLNLGIFKRIYLQLKNDILSGDCLCRPMYMDRMILLSLANVTNWSIAVYGILQQPKDFASYLLSIFMVNLVLYLMFYIIMKLRHKEKFLLLPKLYILLSSVSWGASLFFFIARKSISWELTPAQSREKNRPCEILNFYDDHDIWHFLSAASMFFSFMLLLTMDDDLMFTERSKIPVF